MTDTTPKKLSAEQAIAQWKLNNRLLQEAADGHTETVQTLLAAGADVHAQDIQSFDSLFLAAMHGQTEIVKVLLEAGANVHAFGTRALHMAAYGGHMETVRTLFAAGADIHAEDDKALFDAAMNGKTEMVKFLLKSGANVYAQDRTAFYMTAYWGHMETVQVLAEHIFAPDSWRGKSRAKIEAQANAIYDKLIVGSATPSKSEDLHKAASILLDCALGCWEQIRPSPPKIQISALPAQPKPV